MENIPLDLLGDCVAEPLSTINQTAGAVGYPFHWQVPAATEKAAYQAMADREEALDFVYVGFPWATMLDGLRNDGKVISELLRALDRIRATIESDGMPARRATVVQHIFSDRYIEIFHACGVTDLFWSHARVDQPEIDGIAVHPFPLFPAQTPDGSEVGDLHRPRRWLGNFIGAYNPKIYLSDVRKHIFADAGATDLLIIERDTWHFERAVYEQQIRDITPDEAHLAVEAQHKEEYLEAIRDSVFTLCPTGSGPNSIRIYEALALGSIPVILTRDLALPGDAALWEAVCIFEEDSAEGYARACAAMRAMTREDIHHRQAAIPRLFAAAGPVGYAALISNQMAGRTGVKKPA